MPQNPSWTLIRPGFVVTYYTTQANTPPSFVSNDVSNYCGLPFGVICCYNFLIDIIILPTKLYYILRCAY